MKYCEFGGCLEELKDKEDWKTFCETHFDAYRFHDIDTCLRCGRYKRKNQEFCDGCDDDVLDQYYSIYELIQNNLSIQDSDLEEFPDIFLSEDMKIHLLFRDGYVRTIKLEKSFLDCSNWSYEKFNLNRELHEKCIIVGTYCAFKSRIDYYSSLLLQNKENDLDILVRMCNLFIKNFFPKLFNVCDYVSFVPSKNEPHHMEYIAQGIAEYFDVDCWSLPIERTSIAHSRDYNWENPLFVENKDNIDEYKSDSILIVDDIITSGRTITNIRNVLNKNDVSCTFLCLSKTNKSTLVPP
ncbi:MAG: hypothetical protein ACTSP3_11475 [Candidatus Heimdallarchaeaceae archaeon]